MAKQATSTVYVKHTSRIHASQPASFGPHFANPDGQAMNLIPIEFYPGPQSSSPPPTAATDPTPIPLDSPSSPDRSTIRKACPPPSSLDQIDPPTPHPPPPSLPQDWIALVERGSCSFIDKVRYAQKLGASAVIVGDSHQSSSKSFSHTPFWANPVFFQHSSATGNFGFNSGLLTMYAPGDTSDVLIPSVFVARDSYLSLRQDWKEFGLSDQLVDRPVEHGQMQSLEVIMSKDELWTWPFFDLVIILLFLPSILTIVTLLLHRISLFRKRRADRAPRELVNRLPSVIWAKDMEKGIPLFRGSNHHSSPQDTRSTFSIWISKFGNCLQLIQPRLQPIVFLHTRSEHTPLLASSSSEPVEPVLKKQQHKVFFSQRECALCLSDFEVGDLIRILPCGHCFHQCHLEDQCMGIDCWLLKSKKFCPICRMSIIEEPPSSAEPLIPNEPVLNSATSVGADLSRLPSEPILFPSGNPNQLTSSHHTAANTSDPIPSSSSVTLDHICSRTRA